MVYCRKPTYIIETTYAIIINANIPINIIRLKLSFLISQKLQVHQQTYGKCGQIAIVI